MNNSGNLKIQKLEIAHFKLRKLTNAILRTREIENSEIANLKIRKWENCKRRRIGEFRNSEQECVAPPSRPRPVGTKFPKGLVDPNNGASVCWTFVGSSGSLSVRCGTAFVCHFGGSQFTLALTWASSMFLFSNVNSDGM